MNAGAGQLKIVGEFDPVNAQPDLKAGEWRMLQPLLYGLESNNWCGDPLCFPKGKILAYECWVPPCPKPQFPLFQRRAIYKCHRSRRPRTKINTCKLEMDLMHNHMTRITWIDSLESDGDIVSAKKVPRSWRSCLTRKCTCFLVNYNIMRQHPSTLHPWNLNMPSDQQKMYNYASNIVRLLSPNIHTSGRCHSADRPNRGWWIIYLVSVII